MEYGYRGTWVFARSSYGASSGKNSSNNSTATLAIRMLGRRPQWLVTAQLGLVVFVLRHTVPCACVSSGVSRGEGGFGGVSFGGKHSSSSATRAPTAGFVSPSAAGRRGRPAAEPARSTSSWLRQWLPQGIKSSVGTAETGPRQKYVRRGIPRDHDSDDPPSSAAPRSAPGAGGVPEGRGGGESGDPGVNSLVDLVNLLHGSDNPLWELVRFEVCGCSPGAWSTCGPLSALGYILIL